MDLWMPLFNRTLAVSALTSVVAVLLDWMKNDEFDQNHKHRHGGAARRCSECSLSRGWWWYIWCIKHSRATGHQRLHHRQAGGKRIHSDQTVCWDAQRGSDVTLEQSLLPNTSRDYFLADHRVHPGSDCHDHYDRGSVTSMHELVAADSGLSGLSTIVQRFECGWCGRP